MTTDLTPPPEIDLPPSVRGRRRHELLAIVAHEHSRARVAPDQPRRRLPLAPTLIAAAAVAAVIAAGVFGLPAYRDSHRPAGPATPTEAPHPPAVRKLTAAETLETLRTCTAQTNAIAWGDKGRFAGSEVVDAFTFTEPLGTGYPKTWLTGKRPITALHDGYEICGLDAHGTMVDAALVSLPDKLTGLVEAQGRNHGAFSLPVARVTVQTKDGPELDAVVHNGFWFAPIKAGPMPFLSPKEAQGGGISPDSVVGVYPGVRLRGYSATGRLLYDSERDAYTFGDCYPVRGSACTQIPWQRADPSR